MTDFIKFLNDLSEYKAPSVEIDKLDLENKNDRDKLRKVIDELHDNKLFTGLMTFLYHSDILDELNNELDKRDKKDSKKEINRPSKTISTQVGLKLHKLVQEYVDTMIKPYNPKVNGLTNEQINDAYAGLYEFACWIFQHK